MRCYTHRPDTGVSHIGRGVDPDSPVSRSTEPNQLSAERWLDPDGADLQQQAKQMDAIHLIATEPHERVYDARDIISIRFSSPVVVDDKVGHLLETVPIRIDPPLAVQGFWRDRQTLVLEPQTDYAASTRYTVYIGGLIGARLSSETDRQFSFVHNRLMVDRVTLGDNTKDKQLFDTSTPLKPKFTLEFSSEVRASDVATHCHLMRNNRKHNVDWSKVKPKSKQLKYALRVMKPNASGKRIVLESVEELPKNYGFALICIDIPPLVGNVLLEDPLRRSYATYGDPSVSLDIPDDGVDPQDSSVKIVFNTPVRESDLRKYVEIKPPLNGFASADSSDYTKTRYLNESLKPDTEYTVHVRKGLPDLFGQHLGQDKHFSFRTDHYDSELRLDDRVVVLRKGSDTYTIGARNFGKAAIHCAAIPPQQVAKHLSSYWEGNYPNYGQGIPWKKLPFSSKQADVDFELPLSKKSDDKHSITNTWIERPIDLEQSCGAGSVFLLDVQGQDRLPEGPKGKGSDNNDSRQYKVLANVTDLGAMVKIGPSNGLVWVTRLSSGKTVKGAMVTLYNNNGKRLFRGKSNENGLIYTPGASKLIKRKRSADDDYDYNWQVQRVFAVVEHNQDLAIIDGSWNDGIQMYNFNLNPDRTRVETRIRTAIQSDRGIYRPGETVHIQGWLRELALGRAPRVPKRKDITLSVEDAKGKELFRKKQPLSAYGGFWTSLVLPKQAPLGRYSIQVEFAGQKTAKQFSVEAFRPVAFEILPGNQANNREAKSSDHRPDDHKPAFITDHMQGEPLKIPLQASYLFGSPVKAGKVKWEIELEERFLSFPQFPEYAFNDRTNDYDYSYESEYYGRQLLRDGSGKTDKNGQYTIESPDTIAAQHSGKGSEEEIDAGAYDYLVQATVQDESNQAVSKQLVIHRHPSDRYFGIDTSGWVKSAGTPFRVNAIAVDTRGRRIAAKAALSVLKRNWVCNKKKGIRKCEREKQPISERKLSLAAKGATGVDLSIKEPGSYTITLRGKDSRGRMSLSSSSIYISGNGEVAWDDSDSESAKIDLIPSKKTFKPGEKGLIVPQADTSGALVLMTFERDGVLSASVHRPTNSGMGLPITISEKHAPNVFVSVAAVRGFKGLKSDQKQFSMGTTELTVSAKKQQLSVAISTEKETYKPGERVKGTISVNAGKRPVKAEVALSVVDEGVLQLIDYKIPNPMEVIYAHFGLGIDSATNLLNLYSFKSLVEKFGEFAKNRESNEGGMDGGGSKRSRTNFVSSAYFKPDLHTDATGVTHFAFEAPDNLTAFRLMAAAADKAAKFGVGRSSITIRKPLMATPVLPRFFTEGDSANIGTIVHNYTGSPGQLSAQPNLSGLLKGDGSRNKDKLTAELDVGGQALLQIPVTVPSNQTQATIGFQTKLGQKPSKTYSDAWSKTIPINRAIMYKQTLLAEGQLSPGAKASVVAAVWPKDSLPKESWLEITIDRVGLAGLAESIRYLIGYPHGCLEQTLSKLIPLFKVRDLATSLDLKSLPQGKLNDYISAGVDKLISQQDDNDLFSLWPGGKGEAFLTTYTLLGLLEAKRANWPLDMAPIKRAKKALRKWANASRRTWKPGAKMTDLAMTAYVLSAWGDPDPGLNARLFEAREGLPVDAVAFLLRALVSDRDHIKKNIPQIEDLVGIIKKSVNIKAGIVEEGISQIFVRRRSPSRLYLIQHAFCPPPMAVRKRHR